MTILTSIIALLQVALTLLTASVGTPMQSQATEFATQAIVIATQALDDINAQPIGTAPSVAPQVTPQSEVVQPVQPITTNTTTIMPKETKDSIKVISPINGKGLGRKYVANKEIVDESNYIELGLIVRNDAGESMKDAKAVIEATDEDQNKTLIGTGNVTKIYNGEIPESVYYYLFHYEFKNAGQHTITFTANGMTEVITLDVAEFDSSKK